MFAFCEFFCGFFFFFLPEVFVLLPCVFTFPIIETFYYFACPHPKSGTLYIAVLQSIVIIECLSSRPCGKLTSAHN